MNIHPISTLKDNYVWTLIDEATKSAIVVDPGEALPVIAYLKQFKLNLVGILITHHHWDHTNGALELQKQFDVPIYGPANEVIHGMTNPVHENTEIKIGSFPITFNVIDIPGHTVGHIAYYSPGMVFCGDTLFTAGCGRLFEGTAEQMYASLQKLASLPSDTKIYCGHEYTLSNLRFAALAEPQSKLITDRQSRTNLLRDQQLPSVPSTLSEEKQTNPFLRCDSPELIANVSKYAGISLKDPIEVFRFLRKWKDAS